MRSPIRLVVLPLAIIACLAAMAGAGAQTPLPLTAVVVETPEARFAIDGAAGSTLALQVSGVPLPTDARIHSVELHLVRADTGRASQADLQVSLTVHGKQFDFNAAILPEDRSSARGAPDDCSGPDARTSVFTMSEPGTDFPHSENWQGQINLKRGNDRVRNPRTWYGHGTDQSACNPRLILRYTLPGAAAKKQTDARAGTRTATAFLPYITSHENDPPRDYWHNRLTNRTISRQFWSRRPVEQGGRLYFIEGTAGAPSERRLVATTPLGRRLAAMAVPNAGKDLVPTGDGEFLIFTGGEAPLHRAIIDVDVPSQSRFEPVETNVTSLLQGLDQSIAPLRLPDGSLIFATNTAIVGLDPSFRPLWALPLDDERVGSMVLGPSAPFVYAATTQPRLVAIDRATGRARSLDPPDVAESDLSTIAPLTVVAGPDGADVVYLATNAIGVGRLSEFVNRPGSDTLDLSWSLPVDAPISRVIPDQRASSDPNAPGQRNPNKVIAVQTRKVPENRLLIIPFLLEPTGADNLLEAARTEFPSNSTGFQLIDGENTLYSASAVIRTLGGQRALLEGDVITMVGEAPIREMFFTEQGSLYATGGETNEILRVLLPRRMPWPWPEQSVVIPRHAALNAVSFEGGAPLLTDLPLGITVGGSILIDGPVVIGPNFSIRLDDGG